MTGSDLGAATFDQGNVTSAASYLNSWTQTFQMEANQTTQTPDGGNVSPSNSGGNGNGDLFAQQQQGQPPAAAAPVKPEGR